MKKLSRWLLAMSLLISFLLNAQEEPPNAWLRHWICAIEYTKDWRDYPKAIESYAAAIRALTPNQVDMQLNLVNERGGIYLNMLDFSNAIKDYSFVLNHPHLNQEQKIEALYGRSKSYLAIGKIQEFEKDNSELEKLDAFVTPIAETQDYAVIKVSPYVLRSTEGLQRLAKIFLMRREIKSEKDVVVTPSGLIIIKKAMGHS